MTLHINKSRFVLMLEQFLRGDQEERPQDPNYPDVKGDGGNRRSNLWLSSCLDWQRSVRLQSTSAEVYTMDPTTTTIYHHEMNFQRREVATCMLVFTPPSVPGRIFLLDKFNSVPKEGVAICVWTL